MRGLGGTVVLATSFFLVGCSVAGRVMLFDEQGLSWPEGAVDQHIAFVGEFASAQDVGIRPSAWARLVSVVAGSHDYAMVRPMSVVATSGPGVIYIADPDALCVHRYDLEAARYRCLRPENDAALASPVGLAILADGDVLVSDSQLGRIFYASRTDKALEAFETSVRLQQPTGLFWDDDVQRLFVTDTGRQSVLVFDRLGNLKQTISKRGGGPGEFNYPTYLWRDSQGDLLVADSLNFRLQRFDAAGKFLSMFGANGDQPGNFSRPKGVATDSFGHVYVVDALMHSMQIFNRDGSLLLAIGGQGQDPGQFWLPNGIFITGDNLIFVADSYNRRIQVFRYVGGD
jgi:sugar lactone lactonase YvrE